MLSAASESRPRRRAFHSLEVLPMPSRTLWIALAALTLLAASATAGNKSWTMDDVIAVRNVHDPQVSPDGKSVVYVVSELNSDGTDYNTDLWLVSADGGEPRRLTNSPVADEFPRWSPDGRTIAFLSDRPRPGIKSDDAKPGVTDEAKRQIWLIRPDGGDAWMLSDARGWVSALEWSHDSKLLAFLSKEAKTEERKKKEKEKDDAWTPSQMYSWNRLWVIDATSRKATQLTSGDVHVTGFSLSPDGKQAAYAGQPTPLIPDQFNSDLYVVPTAGGRATPLVQRPGLDNDPSWSPDGKWIAFVSQGGKDGGWYSNNAAWVVATAGGKSYNLTTAFDERVQGLGGGDLVWGADSKFVTFQAAARTAQHLYRVGLDDGTPHPLTSGREVNGSLSYDASGKVAVFLREDGEHPREVVRVRLPDGTPELITDTNPQVRQFTAFKKELISWKGADGMNIEGLVIYPAGFRQGQKCPLVLNVHGG